MLLSLEFYFTVRSQYIWTGIAKDQIIETITTATLADAKTAMHTVISPLSNAT